MNQEKFASLKWGVVRAAVRSFAAAERRVLDAPVAQTDEQFAEHISELALDLACYLIQTFCDQTDGGVAGEFMSDGEVERLLTSYAKAEIRYLRERVADGKTCEPEPAPDPVYLGITMEGGLLQCVHTNNPEAFAHVEDMIVIDFDADGADVSELKDVPALDGTSHEGFARRESFHKSDLDFKKLSDMLDELEPVS